MKERRTRAMGDFTSEAASEVDPLDHVIAERFAAERHPEVSVDGDDPWSRDLYGEGEEWTPGT